MRVRVGVSPTVLLYAKFADRTFHKTVTRGRDHDVVKTLVEITPCARRIQDSTLFFGKYETQDPLVDYRLQCFPSERRLMVTLREARKVIAAAEQKAAEIKQPMNIAVVDEGSNLGPHPAWTVLRSAASTSLLTMLHFAGVRHFDKGSRAVCAGAVGVSGGSGEQGQAVAETGAQASKFLLEKTSYGKQSWSSIRRTGKSGGTANRFSEVIARIAKVRARRDS